MHRIRSAGIVLAVSALLRGDFRFVHEANGVVLSHASRRGRRRWAFQIFKAPPPASFCCSRVSTWHKYRGTDGSVGYRRPLHSAKPGKDFTSQRVAGCAGLRDSRSESSPNDEDQALRRHRSSGSMITKIQVENLSIVDQVEIELGRGLIAITGETGAGKSLISSALSLAAGARMKGPDVVGSNGKTARVHLDLHLGDEHYNATSNVLKRLGVPMNDGGRKLRVTRTIGGKGSSASLNGAPVKIGALRQFMSPLVYTVDANAFELLSRTEGRIQTLDRMLNSTESILIDEMGTMVAQLKKAESCRARLEQRCRFEGEADEDASASASLLHHWVEELDAFTDQERIFMDRVRSVVSNFVNDWGEAMLGPLAEPFLWEEHVADNGGRATSAEYTTSDLSNLWLRLSKIFEAMQDLDESRTKVELARQMATGRANPESVVYALGKIRDLLIDAEQENVGFSQDLLQETHEDLNSLEECLASVGDKLEKSVQSLPTLPITLEEVKQRLPKWTELSRKHAVTPERLGTMHMQLRAELDAMVAAAEALPLARHEESRWRALANQTAGELSTIRRRAARELEDLINPMMGEVGLQGATVRVAVDDSKTLGPRGADRVQFILEANFGKTRGTVEAVASSGEKSRLLLLLETLLPPPLLRTSNDHGQQTANAVADAINLSLEAENTVMLQPRDGDGATSEVVGAQRPCAVLYDEIDAHVGGRTAVAVGRLLASQGRRSQVVVVTHTASVAALADQHLVVDKVGADPSPAVDALSPGVWHGSCDTVGGGSRVRAGVTIREVWGRAREEEIARMAAGDMAGDAASELAREMLQHNQRRGAVSRTVDTSL